ncbi:MAG: BON domain-containing protein [Cyanobacteria bacterium SZAS LIN-3]|nr:BON domain-containing protein [Cyanobacteria bacterium SZAS LIN-3]MBS2008971.1 BON domain-containing protein [Cyanobacteria bacterium SZAS TMP-1]
MKKLLGLTALVVACACVQQATIAKESEQEKLDKSQMTAPDNTSKNRRDKDLDTLTADKASNKTSDVEITRTLRKAIMDTKGLSMNAQNVKIITKNGAVTLRGPVENDSEKATIDSLVKGCNGVSNYTNQLEVKGHNSQR